MSGLCKSHKAATTVRMSMWSEAEAESRHSKSELCCGLQVWRYYLLSVRPEQQDTDFKWSDLQVGGREGGGRAGVSMCSFFFEHELENVGAEG